MEESLSTSSYPEGEVTTLLILLNSDEEIDKWMFQLAKFLIQIHLGYITLGILLLIIVISIFGGIKESYRWIILHQAFWDAIIAYNFICINPIVLFSDDGHGTCFYSYQPFDGWKGWMAFIFELCNKDSPYLTLFLLSFTRFLGLFYSNFHDRITKGFRILWLFLISNAIFIFISAGYIIMEDVKSANTKSHFCFNKFCYSNGIEDICDYELVDKCTEEDHFEVIFYDVVNKIFMALAYLRSPILLALSLIFAISIIARISKQANYQFKNKQKDFWASIRICTVLFLQAILTFLLFVLETHQNIRQLIFYFSGYTAWLAFKENIFSKHLHTLRPIRVFLDALIILLIMTGYREVVFGFFKYFLKFLNRKKMQVSLQEM